MTALLRCCLAAGPRTPRPLLPLVRRPPLPLARCPPPAALAVVGAGTPQHPLPLVDGVQLLRLSLLASGKVDGVSRPANMLMLSAQPRRLPLHRRPPAPRGLLLPGVLSWPRKLLLRGETTC